MIEDNKFKQQRKNNERKTRRKIYRLETGSGKNNQWSQKEKNDEELCKNIVCRKKNQESC